MDDKIRFNGASISKRRNVCEAIEMWKNINPFNSDDYIRSVTIFEQNLIRLGWSANKLHSDHGSFKNCLWKGSIVAKYSNSIKDECCIHEVKREFEQYRIMPKRLKKYFPHIYVLYDGLLLIQDRVLIKCQDRSKYNLQCNLHNIISDSGLRGIRDYDHNHGHSLAGTVKFFDWVYRRTSPWVDSFDRPLKER